MALPRTPALATDCVIFDPVGHVLLIRRKHPPCVGNHALPGGFVKVGETVEDACRREVREEAGIELNEITLVGVYSDLNRDPRGHIVSIAYGARLPCDTLPSAGSDATRGHCQSKFVYFAKTSEPDFVVIDFPAFFRVDLSGSMAAPSI